MPDPVTEGQVAAGRPDDDTGRRDDDVAAWKRMLGAVGSSSVDVWVFRVPDTLDPSDRDLLDEAERTRVDRYVRPCHGAWYGGARAEVKRIVGRRLGVPEHQICLGRKACPRCGSRDHGPPAVTDPNCPLTVSWSRSGGIAAVAVGLGGPIGVDIESDARVLNLDVLVRGALSRHEAAVFDACGDDAARRAVFLRCWTRKEAVLKAAGIGIVAELNAVEVYPEQSGWVTVGDPETRGVGWQVCDVLDDDVVVADGERRARGERFAVAVAQLRPADQAR